MSRTKQQQDKYARAKGLKELRRRKRRKNLNKNKPLDLKIRSPHPIPRTRHLTTHTQK